MRNISDAPILLPQLVTDGFDGLQSANRRHTSHEIYVHLTSIESRRIIQLVQLKIPQRRPSPL
jgi:hypothetical protein